MNFQDCRTLFQVGSLVFVLLAASPALSLIVSFPRGGESFSELWLLGPNHMAKDYPFNVQAGRDYSLFLGVGNHVGRATYYLVYAKFRNQAQPLPDSSISEQSSLSSVYEFQFFVADGDVWEMPVTFGFQNVSIADNVLSVDAVTVNGMVFPFDASTTWDSENSGFYFHLSFELWRYDVVLKSFRFHDRVVRLLLNMTGS